MGMFTDLEKLIIRKIRAVENGSLTPENAQVGKWLGKMQSIDEPAFEKLTARYIKALPKKEQIRFVMA